MNKELLYCIPAGQYGKEGVLSLLAQHPEIRFVSLVGIDLAGNDTDEKIPIEIFMKDYEDFFAGKAVQTDGSSVVFMNIATLNDARVDMVVSGSFFFTQRIFGAVNPVKEIFAVYSDNFSLPITLFR